MPVRELSPGKPAELSRFVELERKLVGHHRLFVSEDDREVTRHLSGRSAFFDQSEVALFVASDKSRRDVARCAAIINRRWQNSKRHPSVGFDSREVGFIGYFAAAPDRRVEVTEMLEQAENWLADPARHSVAPIRRVIAPCNGNALLGLGLRTDAFTESPMFPLPWNPRYYVDYFQRAGYAPRYPFWTYEVDFSSNAYQRFKQDVAGRAGCTVTQVNKQDWAAEIGRLRKLFNAGFRGEWELQEFTPAEFQQFHAWMKDVLPTQFMLFAWVKGDPDPVGFCVGYPDWTPLFRSFGGKVSPAKLKRGADDFVRAGVIGGALRSAYRRRNLAPQVVAAFFRMMEEDFGLPGAFYYFINHANAASRGLGMAAGGQGRILYHCYDKVIALAPAASA